MAVFTGHTPSSDYGCILNVGVTNGQVGLTNVLAQIQDAYGNPTPITLSTIAVNFSRSGYTFQLDGVAVTAASVDINSMCLPNPIALGTGSITLPASTTANRPNVPVNGMIRYNTSNANFEGYANGSWSAFAGTVTSIVGTNNQITVSGSSTVTIGLASNAILPGTGSVQIPGGTTVQRSGAAGSIRFNSQALVFESTTDGVTWSTITTTSTGVTSVSGTSNRISVSPTTGLVVVDIDAAYVGQSTITTLGTISSGTWHGSVIGLTYGGTGANLTPSNGGIFYSTGTVGAILSGTATANQALLSGSSTAPAWSTATYPPTTTVSQLLYSSSANVITGLATANNGVLVTSAGGVPSIGGTLPTAVQNTITSLGTITSGTWHATVIDVTYGGTGDASFTPYAVVCGGTTGTGALQQVSTLGASGYVLTSGGAGTLPTWTNVTGAVTSVSGTANRISVSPTTGLVIVDIAATYVGQTSITTLGALTTGSLAAGFTPVTVPLGGTGNTTFTAYSLICAGTTATGTFQNVSGVGTAAQVLTSNGAAALPTWQSIPSVTPAALTKTDDTNVTLTLGGSPSTALLQATSITAGWTGTLSGTRGGTGVNNGASTITLGGSLTTSGAFASTFTMTGVTNVTFPTSGTLSTTTGTVTSVSGTSNRITSTGGTTPVIDISASYVGQSSITTVGALASGSLAAGFTPVTVPLGGTGNTTFTAYSVICAGTTSTGTFQNVSGVGTAAQVLTSNGAAALPTWQNASAASGNSLTQSIAQASHGFSVGDVVYYTGSVWAKAKADATNTSEAEGIVSAVADSNNFTLHMAGWITTLTSLTAGQLYYLSGATGGAYTATEPTTVGYVSKPLFFAVSTTVAIYVNMRGKVIPSPAVVDQASGSVTMTAGTTYICDNGASLITFTMPASTAVGDQFIIVGQSSGKWTIQLVGAQVINTGAASTSAAGTLAAGTRYDCVTVMCTAANTSFVCVNGYGTFTTA